MKLRFSLRVLFCAAFFSFAMKGIGQSIKTVVYFETGSAKLSDSALHELGQWWRSASEQPLEAVVLTAHADQQGGEIQNEVLAKKRGETVKNWFLKQPNVSEALLILVVKGEREPIGDNNSSAGRKKIEGLR